MVGSERGGGAPVARRGRTATVAAVTLVFATFVAWSAFGQDWAITPPTRPESTRITVMYDPPRRPIEHVLNLGDGQVFAAMAVDPAMEHPARFRTVEEAAYRWQRPVLGWLGWAASGGRAAVVPEALVALTVASVVALAVALARAIERAGGDGRWALLAVVLPGVLGNLTRVGPETLAAALLVVGCDRWRRRTGPGADPLTVACFAAAILARESALFVPAALAVAPAWRAVRGRDGAAPWRDVAALAATVVPFGCWLLVLRAHFGTFPKPNNPATLRLTPLAGVVESIGQWTASDAAWAAFIVVPAVLAVLVVRDRTVRAALLGLGLFATLNGPATWLDSDGLNRMLLAWSVFAVYGLASEGARIGAWVERRRRSTIHPAASNATATARAGASP